MDEATNLIETPTAAVEGSPTPVSESPESTQVTESLQPETAGDATQEGRQRGPDGRFVKATEAPGATPEAQPPVAPQEPAEEDYFYTARGQQFAIEGAKRIPGKGLMIPESSVERVEQLCRTAHEAHFAKQQVRQAEVRIAEAEKRAQERTEFNKSVSNEYMKLIGMVKTDPEAALIGMLELADRLPVLEAQAQAKELQAQLEASRKASEPTDEQRYEQMHQEQLQTFHETLGELKANPELASLTADDWKSLVKHAESMWSQLRVTVNGKDYFRDDLLINWAQDRAQLRREFATAEAAKKHNQEQLAPAVKPVSTPAAAKGTGVEAPKPTQKARFNRNTVDEDIENYVYRR